MAETQDQLAIVRMLRQENAELARNVETLKNGGGGGTSDGVATGNLKSRVDFLHTAYIALIVALITVTIALFGAIAIAANSTNGRVDRLSDTVSSLNREVGHVGDKSDEINRHIDHIDQKLDAIGSHLAK